MSLELFNDVSFDLSEEGIVASGVSGKLKLFSEVEAEHTHDRLAVYGVSTGFELDVKIVLAGNSDEIVKISDGYEADLNYGNEFQIVVPPWYFILHYYFTINEGKSQ